MKLTIAENFFILIHHPDKPRIEVTEVARNVGMIGAIFLDLSIEENIIIEDGVIKVKSTKSNLLPAHNELLDILAKSPKRRKPKQWISRINQRAGKTKRKLLESLEKKGIIEIVHKRFLFIPYIQTLLVRRDMRENLIKQMRGIIFQNMEMDGQAPYLLGLIQACKAHKIVCNDKDEMKQSRKKIKEIIESDQIMQGVGTVIQEMQAAIMAAVIASSAASSAAVAGAH